MSASVVLLLVVLSQTMWTLLFPHLTLCAGFESVIFVFGHPFRFLRIRSGPEPRVWASPCLVALLTFYRQILSLTYIFLSLKLQPPACPDLLVKHFHHQTSLIPAKRNTPTFACPCFFMVSPCTFSSKNVAGSCLVAGQAKVNP